MKVFKIAWAIFTNLMVIIVVLAMFHVVNGPFETVVVVGLTLIYNQLIHSFRIQALQDLHNRIKAQNEFIILARFIRPGERYRNPETNMIETEIDDVTPHIDEYKETIEASNKLVETSYIAMFTAGVIWVIAVWKLFEVLF